MFSLFFLCLFFLHIFKSNNRYVFIFNTYILFGIRLLILILFSCIIFSCIIFSEILDLSYCQMKMLHSQQALEQASVTKFRVKRVFSLGIDRISARLSYLLSRTDLVASQRPRFRGHFQTFESFSVISSHPQIFYIYYSFYIYINLFSLFI